MLITVDDIPDLRHVILMCRRFRQDATRAEDRRAEEECERFVVSSRARYQRALRHLRCAH